MDSQNERVQYSHSLLIEQAARLMGVSRRTVYYRIREGRLQTITTRGGSRRVVIHTVEALQREGERKNRREAKRAADGPRDPGVGA
jgi:excisionase family DNA binding protein